MWHLKLVRANGKPVADADGVAEERAAQTAEAMEQRRLAVDAMLWKVPALALAAQAFLLAVSLRADAPIAVRGIAAGLGTVTALVALQLIAKYRYIEELYSWAGDEYRRLAGLPELFPGKVHDWVVARIDPAAKPAPGFLRWQARWRAGLIVRRSSYRMWLGMLWLFAGVNLAVLAAVLLQCAGVWVPFPEGASASLAVALLSVPPARYGSPPMRLIVARCEVRYTGRLDALLPEALRLIMIKADGSVLVHADHGSYKPSNCSLPL